ncbi:MAG: hypothetical protein AAFR12_20515 [Cyanobacteria bacterium J06626_6]
MNESLMAAKDRLSIDITDLRERVENFRDTPSWRELSLSQKLRVLILERLEISDTQSGAKETAHNH